MLPIEKGCQAIIINSNAGIDGKTVVVGNYIGNVFGLDHNDMWEVDIDIPYTWGTIERVAPEVHLMRIDGYKEEQATQQEECVK